MKLHTIALSQWRTAKALGVPIIDITVTTGLEHFAPTPSVLWAYKKGEVSDDVYTALYQEKLNKLMNESPDVIESFLSQPGPLAIACYCRQGKFCHRHILKDWLSTVAKDNDIAFEYLGEIL